MTRKYLRLYLEGGHEMRLSLRAQDALGNYLVEKLLDRLTEQPNLRHSGLERIAHRLATKWLSIRKGRPVYLAQGGELNLQPLIWSAVNTAIMQHLNSLTQEQIRKGIYNL